MLHLITRAASELLRARFPNLPEDVGERVLDEAQGNPLALLELPKALVRSSGLREVHYPHLCLTADDFRPDSASRLAILPDSTRLLLLLLALDGTGELRVAQAPDENGVGLGDLAAAERAQLVFVDRNTRQLEFRHPLIRSAVVDLSTADERRSAHRELVERWAENPELQAWHLAEATVGPDERAAEQLEWSLERKLRRGDAIGAVNALTRSAELSPAPIDRGRRFAEAALIGADVAGALQDASRLLTARVTPIRSSASRYKLRSPSLLSGWVAKVRSMLSTACWWEPLTAGPRPGAETTLCSTKG